MDDIDWLEPWNSLINNKHFFENELNNEIGNQHILYGKKVTAIGRRYDCDDILYQVYNCDFEFAVVHLTFRKTIEGSPLYPRTDIYKNIDSFVNECMVPLYIEYIN
ncbi:MAG: hypothetical protein K0S41_1476 [Anaerocolumna sp.]|jgi:hypothetical protein|nr:hypothetical protein [Anaerocolumna sp.]